MPNATWYDSPLFQVTEEETKYFFVIDIDEEKLIITPKGQIVIFSSRGQAERYAKYEFNVKSFMVIGMGDTKWKLFQREQPYILVEEMIVEDVK